MAIEYS